MKSNLLGKISLSLGLCTMLMANPVLAQPISGENVKPSSTISTNIDISHIKLGGKIILPDGAILTPISKDVYISDLAKDRGISIQEARGIETINSKNLLALSGNEYYYHYSKTFTYSQNSNFTAVLEATLKMYSSGSFGEIDDVFAITSRRGTGILNAAWIPTSSYSDPRGGSSGFPTTSVALGATGYFEIRSSASIDIGIALPGFSCSGSTSTEFIYDSDTMYLDSTYSIY